MKLGHRWAWPTAVLGAAASLAACSAILGLDAPPAPDAGSAAPIDAPTSSDGPVLSQDGGAPDAATSPPVCASLDAGAEDGATYYPLTPGLLGDGTNNWDFFATLALPTHPTSFVGGTFDGRFIYFAGRGQFIARYDTQGQSFEDPSSWSTFDVAKSGMPGGFLGAVFDGRYVYFVPATSQQTYESVVARYDTTGAFAAISSWSMFDVSTLTGSGATLAGFSGGAFDGRYLYLVPRNDGAPFGRVVRYDTVPPEAGAPADAGDGGAAFDFADVDRWSVFDVSAVNATATGFYGAVFDGKGLLFAPNFNDAFDGSIHSGGSGIAARLRVDQDFESPGAWSTFDLTVVNGLAEGYFGGAFDGRYAYFVPHSTGVAVRFDTTSNAFGVGGSWAAYDTSRVATSDAGPNPLGGSAFDGRFVYYFPAATKLGLVLRYDTHSTFTADCAWSAANLASIDAGGLTPEDYQSAVFDGQYLYLAPVTNGLFARFKAKTPASMPTLPSFYGSFL